MEGGQVGTEGGCDDVTDGDGQRYYRERGGVTRVGQVNVGIPMLKVARVAGLYHKSMIFILRRGSHKAR